MFGKIHLECLDYYAYLHMLGPEFITALSGWLCLVFGMSKAREFHTHYLESYPGGWRDVIACVADRAAWLLVKV